MILFRSVGRLGGACRGPATSSRRPAVACERLEGRALLSSLDIDVQHLVADLTAFRRGSAITAAEVQAITSDIKAVAAVATKPNPGKVAALQAELGAVLAHGSVTPAAAVVLKNETAAVLLSASVPGPVAQQTSSDVLKVLTARGVTKADLKVILGDVGAILKDLSALKK